MNSVRKSGMMGGPDEMGNMPSQYLNKFIDQFFMEANMKNGASDGQDSAQNDRFNFNWLIKHQNYTNNIKTKVNINKNEAATKINLEYVDIIDPQENEMLND